MDYIWDISNKKTYDNRIGHYKFNRVINYIESHGKNHFDNILDIAGGSGRFAIPLKNFSNDITVLDINTSAIHILNEREPSIKTICADFIPTKFNEKFSLIICIEALLYFPDLDEFFKKIESLLPPNGRFIFTVTNPKSWRYFLKSLKKGNIKNDIYNEKFFEEIGQLLKQNNLSIENKSGYNWIPLPLTSNSRWVYVFEKIERIFHLDKWISQSPWILVTVTKN